MGTWVLINEIWPQTQKPCNLKSASEPPLAPSAAPPGLFAAFRTRFRFRPGFRSPPSIIGSNPDPRSGQKTLRHLLLFYHSELFMEKPTLGNVTLGFSLGERLTNAILSGGLVSDLVA